MLQLLQTFSTQQALLLVFFPVIILQLVWIIRLRAKCKQLQAHVGGEQASLVEAGPPSVFQWETVKEAPTPSMDMNTIADGEVLSFKDGRGAIYRFKLGDGVYVNMYHTKAGYRRSGDLHDCTQYDVVLKGRTRLRMLDSVTGREVVREYGDHDFISIPPRTPHMFEFLEDNYLLEWWGGEFKAWYYAPYRDIINAGLQLSVQDTEAMDLSIAPEQLGKMGKMETVGDKMKGV